MAENSGISWTDHTFNPLRGCQKISAGCKFCYAKTRSDRFDEDFSGSRILLSHDGWKEPVKWNRKCAELGIRQKVFCESLGDVFEDWAGPIVDHKGNQVWHSICGWLSADPGGQLGGVDGPVTMDDVRARLFRLIDETPNLDWLLLTKRPENILRMWVDRKGDYIPEAGMMNRPSHRTNVWLGTSVESQWFARKRIPELIECRDLSPVLFLSCEPLLGPVDLEEGEAQAKSKIDWVITGTESGMERRPAKLEWIDLLATQCRQASVPFFNKQMEIDGAVCTDPSRFPKSLQSQEFPEVQAWL